MLVVTTPNTASRKRSAVPRITNFSLGRNNESSADAPTLTELQEGAQSQAKAVIALAEEWGSRDAPVTFMEFEKALRTALLALGRVVVMLFLANREQRVMRDHQASVLRGRRRFRRARPLPMDRKSCALRAGGYPAFCASPRPRACPRRFAIPCDGAPGRTSIGPRRTPTGPGLFASGRHDDATLPARQTAWPTVQDDAARRPGQLLPRCRSRRSCCRLRGPRAVSFAERLKSRPV